MRPGRHLLAQAERFLTAGAPTGLTGLLTHGSPRAALLYTYSSTLEKLKRFPEQSVYRQSTEALTKHRLRIVEETKPLGLEQWRERVQKTVEQYPKAFRQIATQADPKEKNFVYKSGAILGTEREEVDDDMRHEVIQNLMKDPLAEDKQVVRDQAGIEIEPEPSLTSDQISKMEQEIGAGLIEEVIAVAEAEDKLVDTMLENKVWEELEEKPVEGQWAYFDRSTHTPGTQAP